jgi:hypothetical protein
MENNNIFLGKIEKSGCYVNNGKYGYHHHHHHASLLTQQ